MMGSPGLVTDVKSNLYNPNSALSVPLYKSREKECGGAEYASPLGVGTVVRKWTLNGV